MKLPKKDVFIYLLFRNNPHEYKVDNHIPKLLFVDEFALTFSWRISFI